MATRDARLFSADNKFPPLIQFTATDEIFPTNDSLICRSGKLGSHFSDWEIFANAKTSAKAQLTQARHRVLELNQHLIWKLILTKPRNLGQLSASMTEPHFRINININIYNNININVNVKITIAYQVGIFLPPLGLDHSILNNTSEFRTSQLVFIAFFFCKMRKCNIKLKLRNCTAIARVWNWFVQGRSVDQVKWTIFLLQFQSRSFEIYIYFLEIHKPSLYCKFNPSLLKNKYFFSSKLWTIFLLQFQSRSVEMYIFFLEIYEPSLLQFQPGLLKYISFSKYMRYERATAVNLGYQLFYRRHRARCKTC